MNGDKVACAWVWSSLEDLHFGFTISLMPHRPYKIFYEILALEKVLKGLLLYYAANQYGNLCEKESEKQIENLAKEYGHKIAKMLKESSNHFGKEALDRIANSDFDGFSGSEMFRAVEAGYMEARYPTFHPIYEQFKIKNTDMYRDPLGSSGVSKFVYVVNKLVLLHLKSKLNMDSVKKRFTGIYGNMEETPRFINLAFDGDIDKYL